ncbi:MAG TPA: L,D-transpeptidase [Polyangiaceae bacterium]|nr:L,D-transpeptidase [Polyangiaceae bacterium]
MSEPHCPSTPLKPLRHWTGWWLIMAIAALPACRAKPQASPGHAAASASALASSNAPMSTVVVDHGELDTKAPSDAPRLAATTIATTVYKLPDTASRKLGYIRLGGIVRRDPASVSGKGCKGEFYRVYPMGYVCSEDATTDLESPIVRAASRRPDIDKPLPYKYGFVRATSPQYLRIPSRAEQLKSEFKLEEHLSWFAEHRAEVQTVVPGANDVWLDARGFPRLSGKPPADFRKSTELSENELFGGATANDPIPFWLQGSRQIPNVAAYQVKEGALFADRVRRKTGLSFVAAFLTQDEGLERRFAVTVDMRLIPTTKVKPDTGSAFHGLELGDKVALPIAWVISDDAHAYQLIKDKDEVRGTEKLPRRAIVPLTGKARIKQGARYYQTVKDKTVWLRASDLAVVDKPQAVPDVAERGEKWIDISITQQTLVLYEGKRPIYATLVSTGRDGLGDPKTTLSTPRGTFRLQSKHIAAAMDSEENSSVAGGSRAPVATTNANASATIERLKRAQAQGTKLDEEDRRRLANIEKGRDPEYGITVRRGSAGFELRDVPWIQYFASGYALHGAYWHDVFGTPRSHGCVNLSPIDARVVFMFTDPPVPDGFHGINVGSDMGVGTLVSIREYRSRARCKGGGGKGVAR